MALNLYKQKVLANIPQVKAIKISGSYNSDMSKQDFGDIDLIVTMEANTLQEAKQFLIEEFEKNYTRLEAAGKGRRTFKARVLWQKILELRMMTGEPYLHFIDESNRKLPQWLKDKGLKVHQSNLCSEIILPTDVKRTAVCCLSSLNLEYYDEWKNDKLFLRDVAEMLDNVLQYFIDSAPSYIKRAKYSASRERSIGIGALGWHALLQRRNIPWESAMATGLNKQIFAHIRGHLDKANQQLGKERGEAPDAEGTGNRFSHLMAIAPNASSSILMGNTSPSIEPFRANAYRQDTLSGSHLHKNQYLDKIVPKKPSIDYKFDAKPTPTAPNKSKEGIQTKSPMSNIKRPDRPATGASK